jgi:hypothetical protein
MTLIDRRHQVFVSSTFSDLKAERAEIMQALLELDCFPAGMELFPATSATAWDLIKGVIDDSDYYCLVIGGRYGSVDASGIGYTEREYDYAVARGKPVIVFLHKDPGSIQASHSEKTDDGRAKLEAFRAKVEKAYHCKYWSSAEELGGQVSRSLINLRRSFPSDGWIPGKFAADEGLLVENATLKARVSQLEAELVIAGSKTSNQPVDGVAGGADKYYVRLLLKEELKDEGIEIIGVSWDTILSYVGPSLLGECNQDEFVSRLQLCFFHAVTDIKKWEAIGFEEVPVPYVARDQVIVQLRALGYMIQGSKRRAVSDKTVYWRLTDAGEARLIQVQALKKEESPALRISNDGPNQSQH